MFWNGLWTADAGDLLVSAHQFSLAHPPGYPLYTLLVRLVSIFSGANLVVAGGLLSFLCSFVSVYFLYRTARLINLRIPRLMLLGLILILISTKLWLLYSITQEVFMLTVLFISLINYYILKIVITDKPSVYDLLLLFLIFSFGLFHQYILLVYVPVILCLVLKERHLFSAKIICLSLLLLVIGFFPYLFFLNSNSQLYRPWGSSDSLLALLKTAMRENYGFLTLFGSSIEQSVSRRLVSGYANMYNVAKDWYIVFFIASLVGILISLMRRRLVATSFFLLYSFFTLGPFLFILYTVDLSRDFNTAIAERFYLLLYPFIFLGLVQCVTLFEKVFIGKRRLYMRGFTLLFFIVGLLLFIKSFRLISLVRTNNTIELFGTETLKMLPPNSILVVAADVYRFPVEYSSIVKNVRPDVTIVPSMILGDKKLFELNKKWMERKGLVTTFKPRTIHEFIRVNSTKRPVFTNYDLSSLDDLVQVGTLFQYKKGATTNSVSLKKLKKYFKSFPSENKVLEEKFPLYGIAHTRDYIRKGALSLAKQYFEKEDYENSFYFLVQAHRIKSGKDTYLSLGLIKYRQNDCKGARTYWKAGFEQLVAKELALRLSQLEAACFKDLRQANFWNYIYSTIKQRE